MQPRQVLNCGVSPYRALTDLGIVLQPYGDAFLFQSRGEQLILDCHGIRHPEFQGKFIAGDPIDFLAFHLGSYAAAVEHLITQYGPALQKHLTYAVDTFRDSFALSLQAEREQFQQILALRAQLLGCPFLQDVRSWLRRQGILAENVSNMVYGSLGEVINAICKLPENNALDAKSPYLILPYFSNPSTLSFLRAINVQRSKVAAIHIPIQPARHSIFGLHSAVNLGTTLVLPTWEDAVHFYHQYQDVKGRRPNCVSVHLSTSRDIPFRLKHATLVAEHLDPVWGFKLRGLSPIVKVWSPSSRSDYNVAPYLMDALLYRFSMLCHQSIDGGIAPELQELVGQFKKDACAFQRLREHVSGENANVLLDRIVQKLNIDQTYAFRDVSVLETPSGYVATKRGVNSPFSNFTVRIDADISFDHTDTKAVLGRLLFRGQEYPLMAMHSAIFSRKHRDIEGLARTALIKAGYKETQVLPIITDTTYKQIAYRVMQQQLETANSIIGIDELGWDHRQHKFVTPAWEVSSFGTTVFPRALPWHPERQLLHHCFSYEVAAADLTQMPGKEPKAAEIDPWIAIVMAMIMRSYFGQEQRVALVKDTPANLAHIKAIMAVLGQEAAVVVNPNIRNKQIQVKVDGLENYPIFVTSHNEKLMARLKRPFIGFSSEPGATDIYAKRDPATPEQLQDLRRQALLVFERGALRLLSTGDNRSVHWRDWDTTPHSVAETLLRDFRQLGRYLFGQRPNRKSQVVD